MIRMPLKAFLSTQKARTNHARQQILCEKRNLRRDGLCHVDLRLRGGELNAEWSSMDSLAGKKYKFSYTYHTLRQTNTNYNYNWIIQSMTEGPDWSAIQRVEATQELLRQFTNDSLSHASPHSKVSPESGSESPAESILNRQLWTLLLADSSTYGLCDWQIPH